MCITIYHKQQVGFAKRLKHKCCDFKQQTIKAGSIGSTEMYTIYDW